MAEGNSKKGLENFTLDIEKELDEIADLVGNQRISDGQGTVRYNNSRHQQSR